MSNTSCLFSNKIRVGIFDSGLGGLTVVQAMIKSIKNAELFYIADTKNAPYGDKTFQQILQYSLDITQYFIDNHQIDALIIACNTATSAAVEQLRKKYPHLIIIGTEPGIKPAIEKTTTGHVGVLATPATLKGEKYQQLAIALSKGKDVTLYEQACPGLVEQIEKGKTSSNKTKKMLENWLAPMRKNSVDTIVLGCTHYPLVSKMIEEVMACQLNLIQTSEAISDRLIKVAKVRGYQNTGNLSIKVYATGDINKKFTQTLLSSNDTIEHININQINKHKQR